MKCEPICTYVFLGNVLKLAFRDRADLVFSLTTETAKYELIPLLQQKNNIHIAIDFKY